MASVALTERDGMRTPDGGNDAWPYGGARRAVSGGALGRRRRTAAPAGEGGGRRLAEVAGGADLALRIVRPLGPGELVELSEEGGGVRGQAAVGHVRAGAAAGAVPDRRHGALGHAGAPLHAGEHPGLALE